MTPILRLARSCGFPGLSSITRIWSNPGREDLVDTDAEYTPVPSSDKGYLSGPCSAESDPSNRRSPESKPTGRILKFADSPGSRVSGFELSQWRKYGRGMSRLRNYPLVGFQVNGGQGIDKNTLYPKLGVETLADFLPRTIPCLNIVTSIKETAPFLSHVQGQRVNWMAGPVPWQDRECSHVGNPSMSQHFPSAINQQVGSAHPDW